MKGKVFEIGSAKTGTTSLARAMSLLGYKSTHGCPSPYVDDYMRRIVRGDVRLDVIRDHDFVGNLLNHCFERVDRLHPDARFVYLWRDEATWLQSTLRQLKKVQITAFAAPVTPGMLHRLLNLGCLDTTDEQHLLSRYRAHDRRVREHFGNSPRILYMNVAEGWEPLCSFLGEPVPSVEFPHLHKS